ncbi:CLUMA_CG003656, isoform A [Clunio marinus]|uniref:CLUMA_CG003656, isoform A n=1 Tax=Clunio marinus TaxID=568069 RepID=A0A1J1HPE9_9DIPT|nr:CLUMA_CG003656, isoform A [Clunio marinus]
MALGRMLTYMSLHTFPRRRVTTQMLLNTQSVPYDREGKVLRVEMKLNMDKHYIFIIILLDGCARKVKRQFISAYHYLHYQQAVSLMSLHELTF